MLFCLGILTMRAPCAEFAEKPWFVRNGSKLDMGGIFWAVGYDKDGSPAAADANGIEEMRRIVKQDLESLAQEYVSKAGTAPVGAPAISSVLNEFAAPCIPNTWVIDHWKNPVDGSMYGLSRLERSTVLECIETNRKLDLGLQQFLRTKLLHAGDGPKGDKSLQISLTIDSVEIRKGPFTFGTLLHGRERTYITGTIYGDVIDNVGAPVVALKIESASNSWPRNSTLSELMSPTRGGFPGDRTEYETVTDEHGQFKLAFSGYCGIRDSFMVYLSGLDAFQLTCGIAGHAHAKYFYGYRPVPITNQ